jgi:hypothetical protein
VFVAVAWFWNGGTPLLFAKRPYSWLDSACVAKILGFVYLGVRCWRGAVVGALPFGIVALVLNLNVPIKKNTNVTGDRPDDSPGGQ